MMTIATERREKTA
jgi:hypothetical protein